MANSTQEVTVNETSTNATVATDNSISTQENNTQSTQSNEAQALPETGEQSNSGLVTIVASVLLAAGSLLAFRRTSNSK
ncbi:LPXTG cell wall anchor domain-containing protein [Staphylococcus hominis]|uniref:LPXTG cell wall anchor domain-containing protein n=1 Tax=Staphylococcus hominis TaxID=1290 RepID=UPI001E5AFB17|nr:LPXTG cell wall anchor domain-containing protein [Staphylococcus hominis]MDU6962647.1 LPXTG cell wall anchor domain-containing protein [Staphylococcus sp.]